MRKKAIQIREVAGLGLMLLLVTACGPRAHIPLRPSNLPGAITEADSGFVLARRLALVLYLQPDETFPLQRVVAVLHPRHRVIAYQLLWRDDVHGSWIAFTVPTEEEVLWVGYDGAVIRTEDPRALLTEGFGRNYSTEDLWPESGQH